MNAKAPPRWELYRAICEPIRLRLLALAAEEELAVGELAELLGESQPNISRHTAPLRQLDLLRTRKEGTRALLRLTDQASTDPVIEDAIRTGRALCTADGSLSKIADLISQRDAHGRELFNQLSTAPEVPAMDELGAYLFALAPLMPSRGLAVDVGTGDGGLLEVLAPIFKRVVAIDRAEAQIGRAAARVSARSLSNVRFVRGDLDAPEVIAAVGHGADAVFASRIVHHAPRPSRFVAQLADLCKPGGAVVILDYAKHEDESMRTQGDVWLGFETSELVAFAERAGLQQARAISMPNIFRGRGPDKHLPWQLVVGIRPPENHEKKSRNKT